MRVQLGRQVGDVYYCGKRLRESNSWIVSFSTENTSSLLYSNSISKGLDKCSDSVYCSTRYSRIRFPFVDLPTVNSFNPSPFEFLSGPKTEFARNF